LIVPSRRDQIKLTEDEQRELIENERIVVVSSLGPRGWPHMMPLWYVPRDGDIWIWTYAKSQKVRNLERDPRATLLIETGFEYGELRGVQIEAEAEIVRDLDEIVDYAKEMTVRYSEGRATPRRASRPRRRSASRSTSIPSARPPGITASSPGFTSPSPNLGGILHLP
jgi:PPOX class probable F420-dependent enzyme